MRLKAPQLRNNISTVEQLKPLSNYKEDRYCLFEMIGIVQSSLGYHDRGCEDAMEELGFNVDYTIRHYGTDRKYCDFWHYQVDAMFRVDFRNDQQNSIYVGTLDDIDWNKFKAEPRDWQKYIIEKWNELFGHLANKHGWIKLEVSW